MWLRRHRRQLTRHETTLYEKLYEREPELCGKSPFSVSRHIKTSITKMENEPAQSA